MTEAIKEFQLYTDVFYNGVIAKVVAKNPTAKTYNIRQQNSLKQGISPDELYATYDEWKAAHENDPLVQSVDLLANYRKPVAPAPSPRRTIQPTPKSPDKFDYSVLSMDDQIEIRVKISSIKTVMKRTAEGILEIGENLADIQERLASYDGGVFQKWLKLEFGWSQRTAYHFIAVYKRFGSRANFAQLDIAASALYLLADPSTSEDVVDEIVDRAESGESIQRKDVIEVKAKEAAATETDGEHDSSLKSDTTTEPSREEIPAAPQSSASISDQPLSLSESHPFFSAQETHHATCSSCGETHAQWTPKDAGMWACQKCGALTPDSQMQPYTKEDQDAEDRMMQRRNGKHKPKANRASPDESPVFDRCQTPPYALIPLIPYLRKFEIIWEAAAGKGRLADALRAAGSYVVATDILTGQDFMTYEPDSYSAIITNPPYSRKYHWLARCFKLQKPFALLIPGESLFTKQAQTYIDKYGIELLIPLPRIDFEMPNEGFKGKGAQFPTAWFTWGFNVGKAITYVDVSKEKKAFKDALKAGVTP